MAAARRAANQPARARAVALPRSRARRQAREGLLRRFGPSGRSLVLGCGLAALACAAYVAARETSVFAVRSLVVTGAPPPVAAQVRRALAPLLGTSLVALDGAALERRLAALPTVVDATYDRAFPNTLRVAVVTERAAAVVRSGRDSWLVSARGRLVAPVRRDEQPGLPRIWLPARARLSAGAFLPADRGGSVARALALATRFPGRVRSGSLTGGVLVFHLASGLELRMGDPSDVRLKLAVARRALRALPPGTTYLDVSVPERPVAGAELPPSANPQVSSGG